MDKPFKRFRFHRVDESAREKYRETFLTIDDFIWPIFLVDGKNVCREIHSMPGVYHYSVDTMVYRLNDLVCKGLKSVLLFSVPEEKKVELAYSEKGIIQKSIPIIKKEFPGLEIITDVCICSYTEDGHCHIGDNDKTCEILADISLSHARAGANIIAPSDMMDGRVYYIKEKLIENNYHDTLILSYAAKYASRFYGPFRDAANCAPAKGDRRTYQMDYSNSIEALAEIAADLEEGADQIMIKPAMCYLDIIAKAKMKFKVPIVAYNVSGEYLMIQNSISNEINPPGIVWEVLTAIKRAGADRIVTYFVPDIIKGFL